MKIKVCHVTSAHSRYDGRILKKECTTLSENGYDVTLLVNDEKGDEIVDGVKIVSTMFVPKNRIERFLRSSRKMYLKAIEMNADVYHFHDPELIPLGNRLKRKKKKVIFDSHEDVPATIVDKDWIPKLLKKIVMALYKGYEKYSIQKYDALIGVTDSVVSRFLRANKNTAMITNYPITKNYQSHDRKSSRTLCFAGGINQSWKHRSIIRALEKIENVKYILAGPSEQEYLVNLQQEIGWEKVEYKGLVPREDVDEKIYSQSNVGLAIHYSHQIAVGGGTLGTTKFFEYMLAKLPVICSNFDMWRKIIKTNNCGVLVDPNSDEEIKKAIEFLLDNPEVAQRMGENGYGAVLKLYNWESQAKILLNLYESITKDACK